MSLRRKSHIQPSSFNWREGFSLIEVTFALGVLSSTAIVILGLLPIGFASSQRASLVTVSSRLAAEVQAELQEVGLSSFLQSDTSFDIDGQMVADLQGNKISNKTPVYDVCRTVQDCPLPGTSDSSLKRVVVQVLHNPGRQTLNRDALSGLVKLSAGMEERSFEFHVVAP